MAPMTHKELADKLNMTLTELYAWIDDAPKRHDAMSKRWGKSIKKAQETIKRKPPRKTVIDEMAHKYPDSWHIEEGNPNVIGE